MIACACVFFVPLLVSVTCNMLSDAGLEYTKCIKDVKKDMVETIEKSKELTKKDVTPSFIKAMFQSLHRLVAPLM